MAMEFPSWVAPPTMTATLQLPWDLNLQPLQPLQLLGEPPKAVREVDFMRLGMSAPIPKEGDQASALVEELNGVIEENKKLNEMLIVVCENYTVLRSHVMDILSKNGERESTPSKKRKFGGPDEGGTLAVTNNGSSESSSSDDDVYRKKTREEIVKGKITTVCMRTESLDTGLIVKDGYQWRKYGQKITRDNPCPRAYFKCSFAPSCPVKKKVQRSVEDPLVLVATYDSEHNHPKSPHSEAAAAAASNGRVSPGSAPAPSKSSSQNSSAPPSAQTRAITLDLMKSESTSNNKAPRVDDSQKLHQFLAEQLASFLTKDPSLTVALATAISGKRTAVAGLPTEKW